MDYGGLLTDAAEFTRTTLSGDLRRGATLILLFALATLWLPALPTVLPLAAFLRFPALVGLVVLSLVAFLILYGYFYEIYRWPRGPPPIEDPIGLILHGVRLLLVSLIYLVPVLLALFVFGGLGVMGILGSAQTQDTAALLSSLTTLGLGILIALLVWVVAGLVSSLALVRCARRDDLREAFNFAAIVEQIGRIGWVNYIVALLLLWIVLGCAYAAIGIMSGLPLVGWAIGVVIGMASFIFAARYLSLVFDAAPAL